MPVGPVQFRRYCAAVWRPPLRENKEAKRLRDPRKNRIGLGQFLFLFFVLVVTTSCTVAVEQQPVAVRPQACTFEHAPVCAQCGNQQRTFSNACLARSSGFQVMHRGQCRTNVGPAPSRPQACTMEYAPVCGRRGSQQRSFSNACAARSSGFQVVHRGQCRGIEAAAGPAACTREFAPVCAVRDNFRLTFDNSCLAQARGFRPVHRGPCR